MVIRVQRKTLNIQHSTLPKALIHGQFMMIHVQRQLIHN